MTRNGQSRGAIKVKNEKVHVPIGKPMVLRLYETRMTVPPYGVSGNGLQAVRGTNQMSHLLRVCFWGF